MRSCILRPCPNATSQRALGCDPWPSVGSTEVAALLSQERGLILPRTRHRSCVLNSADSAQRSCALRGLGYAFSPLIPIGDGHDGRSGIGSGVNTWRPDPSSPTLTWRPYPGTAGHPRIGMRRHRLSGQPSPCCVGCSATARPLAARPSGYAQRGCRGESAHQSVVRAPGHRPRCKSGLRRLTPPRESAFRISPESDGSVPPTRDRRSVASRRGQDRAMGQPPPRMVGHVGTRLSCPGPDVRTNVRHRSTLPERAVAWAPTFMRAPEMTLPAGDGSAPDARAAKGRGLHEGLSPRCGYHLGWQYAHETPRREDVDPDARTTASEPTTRSRRQPPD